MEKMVVLQPVMSGFRWCLIMIRYFKTTKKLNDQTTRADVKFDPNPHKKIQQKAASLRS